MKSNHSPLFSNASRLLVCLLPLAMLAGCASFDESQLVELRTRHSFEADCSQEDVTATVLNPGSSFNGGGALVGVSGCDTRAIYMYLAGVGWVNNGQTSGGAANE